MVVRIRVLLSSILRTAVLDFAIDNSVLALDSLFARWERICCRVGGGAVSGVIHSVSIIIIVVIVVICACGVSACSTSENKSRVKV